MNKTDNLIKIGEHDVSIKMYHGQRVVTFKDIDMVHERPDGTAKRNFAQNKNHFIEGVDYFIVTPKMIRNAEDHGRCTLKDTITSNRGVTLITKSGYLLLVKMFMDDLAWKIQKKLAGNYFGIEQIHFLAQKNTELNRKISVGY